MKLLSAEHLFSYSLSTCLFSIKNKIKNNKKMLYLKKENTKQLDILAYFYDISWHNAMLNFYGKVICCTEEFEQWNNIVFNIDFRKNFSINTIVYLQLMFIKIYLFLSFFLAQKWLLLVNKIFQTKI